MTYVALDTTVLNKTEYVRDGTIHVVLHVANSTYPWIEATPNDLPSQQWYELLVTEKGNHIWANIEKREEIWTIVSFDNLNIP